MRLFFFLLLYSMEFGFCRAQTVPTLLSRRTHEFKRVGYGSLLKRLNASRLVMTSATSNSTSSGDTSDMAAVIGFFNNNGDSVRYRYHNRTRTIVSQSLQGAGFFHGDFDQLSNGDILMLGGNSPGSVQGVRVARAYSLQRADSTGNIRWTRPLTITGQPSDAAIKLLALPDGGALISCFTLFPNSSAPIALVQRVDSAGAVVWQRTYGRAYSRLTHMLALPDGSYALGGYQERPYPGTSYVQPDVWLLRINASGDTLRSRYYGGATEFETLRDLRPAPRGGLLVTAVKSIGAGANVYYKAWLMQLDSLGRLEWQHLQGPPAGALAPSFEFYHGRPLADGSVLVSGTRNPGTVNAPQTTNYLARLQPTPAGGAQPVWERHTPAFGPAYEPNRFLDLSASGSLTLAGSFSDATQSNSFAITRLSSPGRPYLPNLCQTPPQARLGFVPTPGGDSLRFVSLSDPGPQYAQLVRWRWDFGDGTRHDGPAPPPHRYAPGSGAGTAVRLTVTNNLGCTATALVFPLALGTAAQRALQAQLSVFPNPAPATGGSAPVTVRLPGLRPQPPMPAELLDALGRAVRRAAWAPAALAQGAPLDTHGLAPGVYTLRLLPQEGALVKRLVVQ